MSNHTTHLQVVVMEGMWGEHLPHMEVQKLLLSLCVCVFGCSVTSGSCDPTDYKLTRLLCP